MSSHKKNLSYTERISLGLIVLAQPKQRVPSIGTTIVGPHGEILPAQSMVVKHKIYDPSNPNFTWPLKGESYAVPESELEPMYKIYNEHEGSLQKKF